MSIGVCRSIFDRLLKCAKSIYKNTPSIKQRSEIIIGFGKVIPAQDRLFESMLCLIEKSTCLGNNAKAIPKVGISVISFNGSFESTYCVLQITRLAKDEP